MPFYPNECAVCTGSSSVKRCSRCNMISYCGEIHQKKDWKAHKVVCKIISSILKKKGLSHIYENLRGADQRTWIDERSKLAREVESQLGRPLLVEEYEMFRFPRVCFVCYDARQDKLRNCPGCPLASFCKDHPGSSLHDKNCAAIRKCHYLETTVDPTDDIIRVTVLSVVGFTPTEKSARPPKSMKEYLDKNLRPEYQLPENVKSCISDCLSIPLTLYNGLRKLDQPLKSEMVFHVRGIGALFAFTNSWEAIFHLLPDINSLTVIFTEQGENLRKEMKVCNKCCLKGKTLILESIPIPYMKYMRQSFYKKPDIFAVYNIDPPANGDQRHMIWQIMLASLAQLSCPVIFSTISEQKMNLILQYMRPSYWSSLICYHGVNDFAPLYPMRDWLDWGLAKCYEFLIVTRAPGSEPEAGSSDESLQEESSNSSIESKRELRRKVLSDTRGQGSQPESGSSDESLQEENSSISIRSKRELWRKFFYASICHVCRSPNSSMACKRCKMIFYCGENHRKVHWPKHKNICKVILGMLSESESANLFDKLKTENEELWLQAKLDLLKKAEAKIGGKLPDDEREMFLFPKTCFACHESDLSVLRSCECGINFCNMHKDNSKHIQLCREFSLSRRLIMLGDPPVMTAFLKVIRKLDYSLPSSIESFIDVYLKPKKKDQGSANLELQNILLCDSLSRALTFLYAIDVLFDPCYTEEDSLVVHVIGSTSREISEINSWKFILHWLQHLRNLKIIFVGPKMETPTLSSYLEAELDFSSSILKNQNLKAESHPLRYDDYYRSNVFIKPDFVIGFNLDLHESELGISECTWKDTVLILKKMEVPFIMTSGSAARAKKDDKRFCKLLGDTKLCHISYEFCEVNPFASLIPERDFETEGLRYSNKYILTYTRLNSEIINRPSNLTLAQLEQEAVKITSKLSEMLIDSENEECEVEAGAEKREVENVESKATEKKEIKTRFERNESALNEKEIGCEIKSAENRSVRNEDRQCEEVKINKEADTNVNRESNELLTENILLKQENKLLKENYRLKEENLHLKIENLNLREENQSLLAENLLIKDIRKEVQESIQSVMKDKSKASLE